MMVLHPVASSNTQEPHHQSKASSSSANVSRAAFRRRRSKGTGFTQNADGPESATTVSTTSSHQSAQHPVEPNSATLKPCPAARLVLVSVQNALRMGARTQLNLCPPGRARRELQAMLRQQVRKQQRRVLVPDEGVDKLVGKDVLKGYDAAEDDYLVNNVVHDSDEEASSGDEDDLCDFDDFFSEETLEEADRYNALREPLYTPSGSDSTLANTQGMQGSVSSKLPFNRRKIHFFDMASAKERSTARKYLQAEMARAKKRARLLLMRHLRRVQREERRRKRIKKGEDTEEGSEIERETPEEKKLLEGGFLRLEAPMTAGLSAALIIESLALNKLESVEGMSKCYDGIVAAGMALLGAQASDPTISSKPEDKRPSRSEILSALAPLLITSLEQPAGDAILMLAKLRRMCGTLRYQRRFVQRVAPLLIRPPLGALWCLRHQQDMEAILATAELVFDSAFDIFNKGWYERGQLILADSKRAESLNSAAMQLRNLSHESSDTLKLGFTTGNKWLSAKKRKEVSKASSEPLAEWEVVAVVRHIKVSISSVMATDWSRVASQVDVPRPFRRVYQREKRPALLQNSVEAASPKGITASPRSPARAMAYGKSPLSPSHASLTVMSTSDVDIFGPFSSQSMQDRPSSPPPPPTPKSPPPSNRIKEQDSKLVGDMDDVSPKTNFISSATPPKSPKSPTKTQEYFRTSEIPIAPLSPKRTQGKTWTSNSISGSGTPLSPSASSVGTSASGELVAYRPSAASFAPGSGGSSVSTNYRMLTSTAAERKRTVAACRALRAQIQRFEDAFVQLHGRPPKGNAERAPLATTYAQYREWKRAIRADAACRIQALLRGARTRSLLLRGNNSRLSRIIMKRPGRPGYMGGNSIIHQISIPAEIGHPEGESPLTSPTEYSSAGPSLAPQWASSVVRRRNGSGDRNAGDTFSSTTASPVRRPFASNSGSPPASSSTSDLANLSLEELQSRKRELKRQLKQYDMNFARRHGRMPVKAEKEPIRHLYESYNALKAQISLVEQEGRSTQSPSPTGVSTGMTSRSDSPSGGSDSGHSVEDDTTVRAGVARAVQQQPQQQQQQQQPRRRVPRDSPSPPPTSSSQDLQALRAEKSQLHQMLRSYEREFFEEHRRQVSSFSDIRPVASQYRRYKEIKKAIAALQQQSGER